jgi:methylated-DNA-[protein]-cysteine S-methyltransferase
MSKAQTRDPAAALREALADRDDAARAAHRFIQRADAEGLLDVAYARADSPFGPLVLAMTARGLVRIGLPNQNPDAVLEQLAGAISPRVLELPARLDQVRRELELYFEGRLQRFDLPLDWRLSHGFRRNVLRQTARLPYGQTATYAQMAARAGSARAFRAAGSALGSNPIPIVVPCHRVLRTGGDLGGYGGGLEMKESLLRLEGAL